MTWMHSHKDTNAIIQAMERESDRGAAIIAGTMVEERLAEAIKSRLHRMSNTLRDRIFKGYGPLASFSAKIDIGFAMGLYGPISRTDLTHIQWVRNRFAHRIHPPLSFSADEICDRCRRLQLPKMIAPLDAPTVADSDGKVMLSPEWKPPAEPRVQYIGAVQIFIALLWSEAHAKKEPQPQLFGPRFLTW